MGNEKDDIEKYKEGSLTEAQRHALEKKALHDPFLADALEGTDSITTEEFTADLEELAKKISPPAKSWFTPLRIAAGIIVLIGAGFLFFLIQNPAPMAEEQSLTATGKEGPATPLPPDSSTTLLTLAKPEEVDEKSRQAIAQPKRKETKKADERIAAGETKTGSGLADKKEKADSELMVAEESEKIADIKSDEILDAKKEVINEPVQSVPQVQDKSAISKKESRSLAAISKDDVSSLATRNVSGKVLSADDGSPLPGANVVIKGTHRGTVTDTQGNFSLALDDQNQFLVVSFIGMKPAEINTKGKSTFQVKLSEDVSSLSEVVVGASRFDNSENDGLVIKTATPLGGLSAYNKYLDDNIRYPKEALEAKIKGRVIIRFMVTTTGSLSDFNVVKGIGHGCDDEVIRLVKEGPEWMPSTENNIPVESEVKVRMKFDPDKVKK